MNRILLDALIGTSGQAETNESRVKVCQLVVKWCFLKAECPRNRVRSVGFDPLGTVSGYLDLSKSRLETLVLLVLGLVNGRTVNMSHVASQISGTASISSSYWRLQRFFQYVYLGKDWSAPTVIKWLGTRVCRHLLSSLRGAVRRLSFYES